MRTESTAPAAALVSPQDEHNLRLLANAHPATWHNPTPRNPSPSSGRRWWHAMLAI